MTSGSDALGENQEGGEGGESTEEAAAAVVRSASKHRRIRHPPGLERGCRRVAPMLLKLALGCEEVSSPRTSCTPTTQQNLTSLSRKKPISSVDALSLSCPFSQGVILL